jgi:hypothetical protein
MEPRLKRISSMGAKGRRGRFTLKADRQFMAVAANGATASQLARKFHTTLRTVERKARALGIPLKRPEKN